MVQFESFYSPGVQFKLEAIGRIWIDSTVGLAVFNHHIMELNVPAVLEVGPSFFGSVDNNILEGNVITIQEGRVLII